MNLNALLVGLAIQPLVVLGTLLAGVLYAVGLKYAQRRGLASHHAAWQTVAFYGGLLILLIALDGPVAQLSSQFFWEHMLQHELLMLLVAPLLLLGAPLMPLWRVAPLGMRRGLLHWAMVQVWPRRVFEYLGRWLGQPWVAWILYVGVFGIWHEPAFYDLALTQQPLHVLEHLTFLATALLFWAQIVPSPPLRRRMSYLRQAVYVIGSAMAMNGLAALYMYSTAPLYPYYVRLPRPAGMISALVDQHIAGAVMDVPGTVLLFVAACALVALWLREDERTTDESTRPSAGRWGVPQPSGVAAGAGNGDA